ncbi:STAS domain-containing protein [Streptomyces sp. NPDC002886]|uniref:STAS domain-containing protein n=1 Tax=Streptomyces sp. NPDC002886 TaxID=3364667 RepID=UPI00369DB654
MDDLFRVTVRHVGPGVCEVRVARELDVATAPGLRDALGQAMVGCRQVTIDLAGVEFCDCCGLSVLLAAARTARADGAEIHLRAVPHAVSRLLRLFDTVGAFTIEPPDHPGSDRQAVTT